MAYTFIVVDDHESVLEGTCRVLQGKYSDAKVLTSSVADKVNALIEEVKPDLMVMDLSIPQSAGEQAQTTTGLNLLESLLSVYKSLNFVVQSAHVKSLIRLKPAIDAHQAGFTISDKSSPSREMLFKVDLALKGLVFTPQEMRVGLEVKREWLTLLGLAFNEGMTDRAIAEKMNVSERTIRHYWTRAQDALSVYPAEGYNIRVQTHNAARQAGLLD